MAAAFWSTLSASHHTSPSTAGGLCRMMMSDAPAPKSPAKAAGSNHQILVRRVRPCWAGAQGSMVHHLHGRLGHRVGGALPASDPGISPDVMGCRVLNIDCRLAPSAPTPVPTTASPPTAGSSTRPTGPRTGRSGGDSAGGGLTLATRLDLVSDGLPQIPDTLATPARRLRRRVSC
jgi:hypothetical protein